MERRVSLFGLINMRAVYFPFAMIGIDLVRAGPQTAIQAFTGLASAHLYFFLTSVSLFAQPSLHRDMTTDERTTTGLSYAKRRSSPLLPRNPSIPHQLPRQRCRSSFTSPLSILSDEQHAIPNLTRLGNSRRSWREYVRRYTGERSQWEWDWYDACRWCWDRGWGKWKFGEGKCWWSHLSLGKWLEVGPRLGCNALVSRSRETCDRDDTKEMSIVLFHLLASTWAYAFPFLVNLTSRNAMTNLLASTWSDSPSSIVASTTTLCTTAFPPPADLNGNSNAPFLFLDVKLTTTSSPSILCSIADLVAESI